MPRLRDIGLSVGTLEPGERNAITDVAGVRVGHCTLVEGADIRTGVTVVFPHEGAAWDEPLFAGAHRLNGNGELTGLEWVRESGMLHSPIGLTNTHAVGVVRDALVAVEAAARAPAAFWSLPVVGETWDGVLNDINGLHVRREHVDAAIADASDGAVAEGNVGSGTGMICHGFKGGIGTASRRVEEWTVGVLVQANHGQRPQLRVDGLPVGRSISADDVPLPGSGSGAGSIIAVAATDAPLLPTQCERLAHRVALGVTRAGGLGENFSGDLFICFSTGNRGLPPNAHGTDAPRTVAVQMTANRWISGLFQGVVEATEEAILNALLSAETMTGRAGNTAYALEPDRLLAALAETSLRAQAR